MKIRVSIFDEDIKLRSCIATSLEEEGSFLIVGSFGDIGNYRQKIETSLPDVVLMDVEVAGVETIDQIRLLRAEFPAVNILIITGPADDERIFNAIYAGALGFILKNQPRFSLAAAIKELVDGGAPMSPCIARKVLSFLQEGKKRHNQKASKDYHLTPREIEVLKAVVKGLSYKMIQYELNISYDTVRSHMKKIYEKLHVASLTEVVAKAIKDNIV